MTNKIEFALKAAIEGLESAESIINEISIVMVKFGVSPEKIGLGRESKLMPIARQCKAALAELEKCEPVAEAIRERDRLGFAVVNVIGKLDEIIDATQEVEIDDFLHIAVPIDMWNELQAALEDMPKRADIYTSQQPREWVGLSDSELEKIIKDWAKDKIETHRDYADAISSKLKQLNFTESCKN